MTSIIESSEISELLVPRPYQVVQRVDENPGITTLHVVPVDGELPDFAPAQVSMVGAFGVGEAAISISSPVDVTDYHAYTIRDAGPISGALVETPVGAQVTIRGPFGTPWPLDDVDTSQLLILGGGLGIAPLRALIHESINQGDRFDRLVLAYGAKSPADLVYRNDLVAWANTKMDVLLTVDNPDDRWAGPVGVVPSLLGPDGIELGWADTTAFVCGPDVMMHFTAASLIDLGVDPTRIWVTLERNMQCGNALCGHCQLGPFLVCRDGPVVNYAEIGPFHQVKSL